MITVYSKNGCPHCVSATTLLDEEDMSYEVRKIDEDKEAADFIQSKGHRSVPQIYRDGNLLCDGYQGLLKLWRENKLKSN